MAIALLTTTARALLLPLAVKPAHSVRAQRALRPQLDRPQASLA